MVYFSKHVVFGQVVSGQEIVKQIENLDTDKKNRPLVPVTIANSGELVLQPKAKGNSISRQNNILLGSFS
jgi:peptidyl-prolyl isomerase G (cyclophilin G)